MWDSFGTIVKIVCTLKKIFILISRPNSSNAMAMAFQDCRIGGAQEVQHEGSGLKGERILTLHPDFKIDGQGRKTERNDYDIALLRLDYPIMDEGTGITVLQVFKSRFHI